MDTLPEKLDEVGAETEGALERFMNDEEMLLQYLRAFPDEKTMGTLVQAMENKDYLQAEKSVHALKGLVINLGFLPLADATADMLAELRGGKLEDALKAYEEVKTQYRIFCDVIKNN